MFPHHATEGGCDCVCQRLRCFRFPPDRWWQVVVLYMRAFLGVFDALRSGGEVGSEHPSIVVVVSPLLSLNERSGIYAIFSSRGLNYEFVGTGLSIYSVCHHSCDANSSYTSCHSMIDGYRVATTVRILNT